MRFKLAANIDLNHAPETDEERYAVRQLKGALNRLGYYIPDPATGMADDIDNVLKDAVYAYQRNAAIFFDDVDLNRGSTTERLLDDDLDYMDRDYLFSGTYIWRTVGDNKVRGEHAHRNGQTFLWSDPPNGGHPGEDYNCRCWAEHTNPPDHHWPNWARERRAQRLAQSATVEKLAPPATLSNDISDLKTPLDAVKPVSTAWSAAAILIVMQLGGIVPIARIVTAIRSGNLAQSIRRQTVDRHLFKRPEGVPDEWIAQPLKKGIGMEFTAPKNTHRGLRIEKGNPNSSQPGQRYDNIRCYKDGKSFDVNGNLVANKSQEAHVPIKDFKFRPELFE